MKAWPPSTLVQFGEHLARDSKTVDAGGDAGIDSHLHEDFANLVLGHAVDQGAPLICTRNSCGRFRIEIIARLSMLRVLRGNSSRPHTAPQQYSVTSSWNGLLKSSAFFKAFET